MSAADSPSRAMSGRLARPPSEQRLAHHGGGKAGGGLGRFGIERGKKQRTPQALIKLARAAHGRADRCRRARPQERNDAEIVVRPCPRHAPGDAENPPAAAGLGSGAGPSARGGEVDEWNFGVRRPGQRVLRADQLQIGHRRMVARQQEMVAVVDHRAEKMVVVGASSARRPGRSPRTRPPARPPPRAGPQRRGRQALHR